jgi:hypothetical protein
LAGFVDQAGKLASAKVNATSALLVDGSAVTQPVSGSVSVSNFPATQPVSGTVAATQSGTWNLNNISGTVSLPTGAATSAKQPALGTAGTPSTDILTVQGAASMTALKVDGSAVTQPVSGSVSVSNFPATQPISGTVTANQGGTPWSENITQFGGNAVVTGTGASGVGIPRVTVSNDSAVKITDGTNTATIGNLTNNKPLATMIVDGAGTQITSFGGGTQYAQGTTQASPTGTVAMAKNPSNAINALSTDASGNLNVNLAAGSISGGNAAAGLTGAAVPTYADYTGFNSGGNLVGVSAANPLPVTSTTDSSTAITGSVSANGNVITSTSTLGYNSISVQLTGTWQAQVVFQSSNDNTNWVNTQAFAFNSTASAIDTAVDDDIYLIPVVGRYFRAVVQNYVAGTVVATAYLRIQSLAGIGEASLTQAMDQATGTPLNIGFQGFQGPGQQPAAYSLPVALPNEQVNDFIGIGGAFQAGYTTVTSTQNLLAPIYGSGAPTDCLQYRYIFVTIESVNSSTSSGGSVSFEYSNDGFLWTGFFLTDYNAAVNATGPSTVASLSFPTSISGSATSSNKFWGVIPGRYVRIRPTTTLNSVLLGPTGALCRLTYRLSNAAPTVYTSATYIPAAVVSNISQVSSNSVVPNGSVNSATFPGLPTGGVTNPYSLNAGPLTGASALTVRNVTDRTGAQTVAGVTAIEAENPNTIPVNVRLERSNAGQDSVQDLLLQILLELRALNYYTRETPVAIATLVQSPNAFNSPVSMQDDPENFADDSTTFRYQKGH